ncbi:MAG: hypothetical protein ACR2JW_19775, partial [Thermomicrobiales bacterium]
MVYTDPQGRFSFTVPDGYEQTLIPPQQQGMVVARFASAGIDGLLIVQTQNMEPNATLDLKTAAAQNTASKFPGSQSLTPVPLETTVAGQAARQYEWLVLAQETSLSIIGTASFLSVSAGLLRPRCCSFCRQTTMLDCL